VSGAATLISAVDFPPDAAVGAARKSGITISLLAFPGEGTGKPAVFGV
jgi:hypothetical protein